MPPAQKVLCVAEKNDAAKNIANILSTGRPTVRRGGATYNMLYCFEMDMDGQRTEVVFTSVSGHMMEQDFGPHMKGWRTSPMLMCFTDPLITRVSEDSKPIEKQLIQETRSSQTLIIWTDCDREGEHIGAEIVRVCQQAKPSIRVKRARFSQITPGVVHNAMRNLIHLNENAIAAVECRAELDLRIGAAFTRLQTIYFQDNLADAMMNVAKKVVSYGSCQFPTLGFVVERYLENIRHISEPFWKLAGRDVAKKVDFTWERVRLFDQQVVALYLAMCNEEEKAYVVDVTKNLKSRWRPVALDTIEMEKLSVRKLRIPAKRALKAAERLYTSGYISYPRTETNRFGDDINLHELVNTQTNHPTWGAFAADILQRGGPNPRNGNKSDAAHPPIHPLKVANKDDLKGPDDWRVYELVVRHFLACCSRDAKGQETKVKAKIADEHFLTSGLIIEDLGYMHVYPYDKWTDKTLPPYQRGEVIKKFLVSMTSGSTTAPPLLTEADLIALMDKHGIGTDATHADHIDTIKTRNYVSLTADTRFLPTIVGLALVDAYRRMGRPEFSGPQLRAGLERELVLICEGRKNKAIVLEEQLRVYRNAFEIAERHLQCFADAHRDYQNNMPPPQ